MNIQSFCRKTGLQVRLVRMESRRKVRSVRRQADRVPVGMLRLGVTRSPERLAPDMMPVTPEKRTANTREKETSASESWQSC